MTSLPTDNFQDASTTHLPPTIELKGIRHEFGQKPDLLLKGLQFLGAAPKRPMLKAVDNVNMVLHRGEVIGLVGESGCGKSTLGRIAAGILKPTAGQVLWNGHNLNSLSPAQLRQGKLNTQMVFQNPFAALNPRMTVADIIKEAPMVHGIVPRDQLDNHVAMQLERAGLDVNYAQRYPHEFSGGQRQRIVIARALAVNPVTLVCDESVAALDVSIQAQILNLFMELREKLHLAYLFISHDLSVVEHLSDRVAVMYLGRIVEEAPVDDIFSRPRHPYTQALLEAIPRIEDTPKPFTVLKGELPSPMAPPTGCHFHPRCWLATKRCALEVPQMRELTPGHRSACHLNDAGGSV